MYRVEGSPTKTLGIPAAVTFSFNLTLKMRRKLDNKSHTLVNAHARTHTHDVSTVLISYRPPTEEQMQRVVELAALLGSVKSDGFGNW